jgi:hypothetical protein
MVWFVLVAFVSGAFAGGTSRDGGSSSSSSSSASSSKSTDSSGAKKGKKKKIFGWSYQPYVMPGGGVTINEAATSVNAGVDVGIDYWRKKWIGNLYVGGAYTTGDGLNGYEVHLGDVMGAREKYWGLTGGLELVYNGYTYSDGSSAMKPSGGVNIPIELAVGPKKYYGYAGVVPGFFTDASRNAQVLGVFHELEWRAGVGVKVKWIRGEVGIAESITSAGAVWTPTLTLNVSGLDLNY